MRIPTILGLVLLSIWFALAVFFYLYYQNLKEHDYPILTPNNIQVVNIGPSATTITWQTNQPAEGQVDWGETPSLGDSKLDDRDRTAPLKHLSHFVSLKNLTADKEYFFQVKSNLKIYPDAVLKFKTAKANLSQSLLSNKPILGAILNSNLQPVDEAIVTLKIADASPLATLSTTAGNFILPTANLLSADLTHLFILDQALPAQLLIQRGDLHSLVKLTLPVTYSLPNIILGQDLDFSLPSASSSLEPINPYDLDKDGKVNTIDLGILIKNLGAKKGSPNYKAEYDFDSDGIIDQKDVDLMKKALK